VLRLDKIHTVVSGNKWFKLKYYLQEAQEKSHDTILTFGGAYSNHIIATAYAAKELGLKSIGIIRGEEPSAISHTLLQAKNYGMQLEFISRDEYKGKNEVAFQKMLADKFSGCFAIPEGGAGASGIKGSAEISDLFNSNDYTHILCAVGTGTMFAGLANSSSINQKTIGICVLKGMHDEYKKISTDIKEPKNGEINHDYHFGGYAKKNDALIQFMNRFYNQTNIASDFVYTGKLFYAALDLARKNYFDPEAKLLIIHSGGLQGNASLAAGTFVF
jgi:1-aminocyclopropane-1-carboxylate deaminase/D-cysteine desulfhydrase-like pyridoxal-dependent ACC family enzyme